MTPTRQLVIQQTKDWVREVVIGLNLCPFAAQPFQNDSIEYIVDAGNSTEHHLHQLADYFPRLDESPAVETSLLIYPDAYQEFDDYLDFLYLANLLLEDLAYPGTYQIASFHPGYRFEGSDEDDASNFSNRSPYPMLHLIRENSLERAISSYPDIEQVPEYNIKKLREIGYEDLLKILKRFTA
jgi:hypothetical protein